MNCWTFSQNPCMQEKSHHHADRRTNLVNLAQNGALGEEEGFLGIHNHVVKEGAPLPLIPTSLSAEQTIM